MLKRTLLYLVLSFFYSVTAYSQIPTEKSLLWEISGNGLKSSSYLYGTFHLLCENDLKLDSLVYKKLNTCSNLYLELDFDDPNMITEMQQAMMKGNGESVKKYVTEEEFKQMNDAMQKMSGYPLEPFVGMKPMLTASFLYPGVLGCAPSSPEGVLVTHATTNKMGIHGLETVARQMSIFDKIPFEEQTKMLKEYLLTPNSFKTQTEQMLGLYRTKDVPGMYAMMEEDGEMSNYLDIMLFERNTEWIEKIKANSAKSACFYAVGAGHLGGEYGVISLLRKAGFTVSPSVN